MWFLTFLIMVDTANDCLLAYESLGCLAKLTDCYYVQPRCVKLLPPHSVSEIGLISPNDDWKELVFTFHHPKGIQSPSLPHVNPNDTPPAAAPSSPSVSIQPSILPTPPHLASSPSKIPQQGLTFISTISHVDIIKHFHHTGTVISPV